MSKIKLYIFGSDDSFEPQKIDINRAQAWLLEALPGIGPTLAQRIVDYCNQNGPFDQVEDLMEVDGIVTGATYAAAAGGGYYVVTIGLFIAGAIAVLTGLWRLIIAR